MKIALLVTFLFSSAFLTASAAPPQAATPMTDLERQRLIAHFEMTGSWLADEVSHLSPAQLKFKPSPGAWSVLDCVEHLDLSETEYWKTFHEVMASKPARKTSPSTDIDRLWYGIDRTRRDKTIPSETPHGEYSDLQSALAAFEARRAVMVDYIKTSQDDLRHHLVPEWDRDAYQWLLMISAHSQRHILQIREIKHDPQFPQA